jgi:hypothetical protein
MERTQIWRIITEEIILDPPEAAIKYILLDIY